MNKLLGVKDVSKIFDVTTVTIRNWERTGKLHAQRTPSGVRIFSKADVDRLTAEIARRKRSDSEK